MTNMRDLKDKPTASGSKDPNANRREIYYWKCDRPAAFHGVLRQRSAEADAGILSGLHVLLREAIGDSFELSPAVGEGTHRTFLLRHQGKTYFVRVEDGPEKDAHLDVESRVMAAVAKAGVRVPHVYFTDASRQRVPFAVQVIEYFECQDLNRLHRDGKLQTIKIFEEIGKSVAQWQSVPVQQFGPFDPQAAAREGVLRGYHVSYATYFHLHLDRHLQLLVGEEFLSSEEAAAIRQCVDDHQSLLAFGDGCLVHKDLALWNILGNADGIVAFIDWDDAIAGDPTDDLSLLACFHPAEIVQAALRGYQSLRPLPENFQNRFWLHLLRNMIVKSVIRCGAGYFKQTTGNFLMAPGQSGASFKIFTRERLFAAHRGLLENRAISSL